MRFNPGIKDALFRFIAKNTQIDTETRVRLAEMAAREARVQAWKAAHPPLVLTSHTMLSLWMAGSDATADQPIDQWDAQYLQKWFL